MAEGVATMDITWLGLAALMLQLSMSVATTCVTALVLYSSRIQELQQCILQQLGFVLRDRAAR